LLPPETQVSVIIGPKLRALDEAVSGSNPFELLLGSAITTTDIWMIYFSTVAERRSDLPVIRIGSNTENIIDRFHGTPVPMRGRPLQRMNPQRRLLVHGVRASVNQAWPLTKIAISSSGRAPGFEFELQM
jgi:hypothetical protein